jgi:hypothetical protein
LRVPKGASSSPTSFYERETSSCKARSDRSGTVLVMPRPLGHARPG